MSHSVRHSEVSPPDPETDDSPFALGLLLRRAHDLAAAELAQSLVPFGLGLRHFAVVMALDRYGAMSQRELVDALGKDAASIVRAVDDLEKGGLAVRRPVPADRRRHAVDLTDRGREVLLGAHVGAAPIAERLSTRLGPGEARLLIGLLRRFCDAPHHD